MLSRRGDDFDLYIKCHSVLSRRDRHICLDFGMHAASQVYKRGVVLEKRNVIFSIVR